MEERKFLNMILSVLDKKEQLVFKDKIIFFDESLSEYKHILRHFCHACVISLLNFMAYDLNKISLDSYVLRKTWKYYILLLC